MHVEINKECNRFNPLAGNWAFFRIILYVGSIL